MEQTNNHTLGKPEKLKHRKEIQALFGSGQSFFVHPIKVFYKKPADAKDAGQPAAGKVQVGVSASKRQFKKAVDRNRVKRLLREAYRLNKQELVRVAAAKPVTLHLFFLYVDKSLPTFSALEEKMKTALQRLVKMLEEKK